MYKKLFILVGFIFLMTVVIYFFYKEGALPIDKNNKTTKIFVIKKGETLNEIANNLSQEGLIRNKLVFYLIVKQLNIDKKIQAGDFRLSRSMNAYQIANSLTHGTLDLWITFIEGTRKEEMAQIISQNFAIPEAEFINNAKEGYLFPDTYLIPREATAGSVITILEKNFNNKFDLKLQKKAELKNLSLEDTIIIASLVEREARLAEDKPLVASVILNRLEDNMKLDIDASVQYALGYQPQQKTWWKKDLTQDDLTIKSPYNTYINADLPPSAICNPGLIAIEAVINAPKTEYFYYLSDKNSAMHYAKTLEDHNENVRKYLQ